MLNNGKIKCKDVDCESPWKLPEEFHVDKSVRRGRRSKCKVCYLKRRTEYNNKPENKKRKAVWHKKWAKKPEVKVRNLETGRKHYHTPHGKQKSREVRNNRLRTDPIFRLGRNMSKKIRANIKKKSKGKHFKNGVPWERLVGFTADELYQRINDVLIPLVPGATQEDLKNGRLHLDHIRPVSSFSYQSPEDEDFKKCWSLGNFQLLWNDHNVSKSNRWDGTQENKTFNLSFVSYNQLIANLIIDCGSSSVTNVGTFNVE